MRFTIFDLLKDSMESPKLYSTVR